MPCLLFLLLCWGAAQATPPPPVFRALADTLPGPVPRSRAPYLPREILDKSFAYQLRQAFDLPRLVRKLAGRPYEALDVDEFDEVPNSTWFTNRNHRRPLSAEEIRRGPNRSAGPDTTGPWTVLALKAAGVTPGLVIADTRGDRYIVKFDPPDYPELPSGAEMVGTRLFYAAGYQVPENYLVHLDPAWLVPGPKAVMSVESNDKRAPIHHRPMDQEDLRRLWALVNPQGKPRVRALASRYLHGKPVGPWSYTGVRRDDPNDHYPHEHRRVLRGLYLVSSWLNHADMKEENTLDMYDPEQRHLVHYLLDFGASLGSNSTNPSNPRRGQANSLDVAHSLVRLFTLGLYVYDYEQAPRTIRYPSLGYLENELFEPGAWKPMYPVPAFENLTGRDAFWGARIVTAFTDAQIGNAVAEAQYSDPEAAAQMGRFLGERRDHIGRYWFARLNTLDCFAVDGQGALLFADLAVERGYAPAGQTTYRFEIRSATDALLAAGQLDLTRLPLKEAWKTHEYLVVSLAPQRPGYRPGPVLVYLRPGTGGWEIAGLRRPQ